MLRKKITTLALILSISLGGILAPLSLHLHTPSSVQSQSLVSVDLNQTYAAGGLWLGFGKAVLGVVGNVIGISLTGGILAEYFWPIMSALSGWLLSLVTTAANMAGNFLDYVVQYSLTKNIGSVGAVNVGWGVVRDISNIFLIFILIWIAISTILGLDSFSMKKSLPPLIMVAVFINFSLFATKLIIDSSNIVSLFFYKAAFNQCSNETVNGVVKPCPTISSMVMKGTHLQELWNPDLFNNQGFDSSSIVLFNTFIIIFVGMTCWIFFTTALLLFARLLTFLILMIFAPFAFLGYVIPAMKSQVGGKWWDELTKQALLAPVFFFMFYLISKIISDGVFEFNPASIVGTSGSSLDAATGLFNFFVIIGLVYITGQITKKFSSEFGKTVVGWGGAALGFAAGAVTGGVAKIGRSTVGNLGNVGLKSEKLKDMATSKNVFTRFVGKTAIKASKGASESSLDLRKTQLGGFISKQTGINFDNKALSAVGMDTGAGKGGYVGEKERKVEKELDFADLLKTKMSDKDVSAENGKNGTQQKKYDEEKMKEVDKKISQRNGLPDEAALIAYKTANKAAYDAEFKSIGSAYDRLQEREGKGRAPVYETASELNKARIDKHIENLKNPLPGGLNVGQALGVGALNGILGNSLKGALAGGLVLSADNAIQSAAELEAAKKLEKKNKGDVKKAKDIKITTEKLDAINKTLGDIKDEVILGGRDTLDDNDPEVKKKIKEKSFIAEAEYNVRKEKLKEIAARWKNDLTDANLRDEYMKAFEEAEGHKEKMAELKNLFQDKENLEKKKEDLTGKKEDKK